MNRSQSTGQLVETLRSAIKDDVLANINPDNHATLEQVFHSILESDFREIADPTKPGMIQMDYMTELCELNGEFLLQLMDMSNISESEFVKQSRALALEEPDENIFEPGDEGNRGTNPIHRRRAPRALKLLFTDGINEYIGFEHTHLLCIPSDALPGSKILLKGPMVIRRGLIFLEERNVQPIRLVRTSSTTATSG